MSTRSQILFRDVTRWTEDGDQYERSNELLTYKHSDGYPRSIVPLLRNYYCWSSRTGDFEYFTATWFY